MQATQQSIADFEEITTSISESVSDSGNLPLAAKRHFGMMRGI